jgi:hypothetical protein
MKLRGVSPSLINKRLKLLMYGAAGTGKTTASLSLPNPYLIDTERGAEHSQYKQLLEKQNGAIFQTDDLQEVISEVRTLLTIDHNYKTLIIDTVTVLYNNALDMAEKTVGSSFGRHFGLANKEFKKFISLLLKLDMNVILTAHTKDLYGDNLSILGQTYDGYKKLDYIFDLVLEIKKDTKSSDRLAKVKKTRITTFKEEEEFVFNYKALVDRYGKDIIEKKSTSIELITDDQRKTLELLLIDNCISEEKISAMLEIGNASKIEEMESSYAQKCINKLSNIKENKNKINNGEDDVEQ